VVSRFSWSVFLIVVLSHGGHSFFVVSRLNRRGQPLWSVVVVSSSSWSVSVLLGRRGQSFFVDGVYILWWLCTRIY